MLACVDPHADRGDWYHPDNDVTGDGVKGDPANHKDANNDPLNPNSDWPKDKADAVQTFWAYATEKTGAVWTF